MEIKGLVIDIKKQAILILTPTGKTVVVKADGDHFERAAKLATSGDWMCFTGKGEIVNATATLHRGKRKPRERTITQQRSRQHSLR